MPLVWEGGRGGVGGDSLVCPAAATQDQNSWGTVGRSAVDALFAWRVDALPSARLPCWQWLAHVVLATPPHLLPPTHTHSHSRQDSRSAYGQHQPPLETTALARLHSVTLT